jgi:hypothetical protein
LTEAEKRAKAREYVLAVLQQCYIEAVYDYEYWSYMREALAGKQK